MAYSQLAVKATGEVILAADVNTLQSNFDAFVPDGSMPANALIVKSTGFVGIGVASPSSILHTDGGNILFQASGQIIGIQPGNNLITVYSGDSDSEVLRINYRGRAFNTTYFRDFGVYDGKGAAMLYCDGSAGAIGVGTTGTAGKMEILVGATFGAPALVLDQDDEDQAFINFDGHEAVDDSKNISSGTPTATTTKYVRVELAGVEYWIAAVTWA